MSPMILPDCEGRLPQVDPTAKVMPTAVLVGAVNVGAGCFIAPHATIRADEPGSLVVIGDDCNIQDNVVVHALTGSTVAIGKGSSLGHSCIVHGPCGIGRMCFIGFGAVVFHATLGDGVVVMHRAVVHGADLPPGKLVPTGAVLEGPIVPSSLPDVPEETLHFVRKVIATNMSMTKGYQGSSADELERSVEEQSLKHPS
jgi:carbonic anhydrase/acetyltransferase-like protein (isoleucine patch superfamily)